MAFMKRLEIELWALGFAAGVSALLWPGASQPNPSESLTLSAVQVRAESAAYLDAEPDALAVARDGTRWSATDGDSTAWLDARGRLLEVHFAAPGGRSAPPAW